MRSGFKSLLARTFHQAYTKMNHTKAISILTDLTDKTILTEKEITDFAVKLGKKINNSKAKL